MKKFLTVVKIILITLLVLALGGYAVLYIVDTERAKAILATAVKYANTPLPIVGVSSIVVAVLVWKIFSSTIYGKKVLNKMKEQYEDEKAEFKKEYEELKAKHARIIKIYEDENDVLFNSLIDVCGVSANKKIKEIGINLETNVKEIKDHLKKEFDEIVDANSDILIKSKEEIIETVVELVKKELVEKYGEEGKEAIKRIAESKKI